MNRVQVWSNGGGVQSSAIAVLIAEGKLPAPDLAVIADTEREGSATWDYLRDHIGPMLADVGVKVWRVRKSEYTADDLYVNDNLLIPAFSTINGVDGKQPGFCSDKWKKTVVQRFCRDLFPDARGFDMWMGISTDELGRVKVVDGKWRKKYPLIEKRLSRNDCMSIVEKFGLPVPPRSSCWCCPNHTDYEWRHLKENCPGDFARAVDLEAEIRKDQPWITFHKSGPLSEVEFGEEAADMFSGFCDSGMCFT